MMENSEELNRILNIEDPDQIANRMIEYYNRMIEELAPSRVIQIKKDDMPYYDEEVVNEIKEADDELKLAIEQKNDQEQWRAWKRARNKLSKLIETKKLEYYINQLKKPRKMLRIMKDLGQDTKA